MTDTPDATPASHAHEWPDWHDENGQQACACGATRRAGVQAVLARTDKDFYGGVLSANLNALRDPSGSTPGATMTDTPDPSPAEAVARTPAEIANDVFRRGGTWEQVLDAALGPRAAEIAARATAAERERLVPVLEDALDGMRDMHSYVPVLEDALDGMRDMHSYVPGYFSDKWDHQGYIDRLETALADLLGGAS